ncbi:Rehydrin [Halomicronema hongdechloris C2206]|uniref:thioredoxin-dependent peroxiredoxin n=1 Tax=Halomicronema hongdechloris C2206 TaxID=1641165 RepID=A0A1Z3HHB0_9CYAN|nr:peroxiredoxin [Halomicronema hongdechloris]ASC69674.1 Rehydrin [Halomicronema hongdechloris C2206]
MVLAAGAQAPNFTAKDEAGNSISLSDFQGRTVVLYFYPKDDTPGCTKEAQGFRDAFEEYQGKDIIVLGVSMDDETSHKMFKEKYGLPFKLVADADGSIARAYDVEGDGYAKRVTYIINSNGGIDRVYEKVQTDSHAKDILAEIGG